ncbi:MAG: DJ-1/PfpI family protein [Bacteroidota bacterium]|nr:DJ-1/PfpI family protein [Bacteroidota bacterium]
MKKVCVHLASGFEEVEAISIVDVLRRADILVETISMTGNLSVTGAHNITLLADRLFEDTDYDQVEMIVLPGGMPGSLNLDKHEGLKAQIIKFHQQSKPLAAICAAPIVYGHLGILKNQQAVCYPGFEAHLTGAKLVDAPAVHSGNFITGKGPGTALLFALAIVEHFKGKDAAVQIKRGMCLE